MDEEKKPYARAAAVLQACAWLEGTPEPFALGSAFDPQAVESWNRCVDAVAALPDAGGPLGIARRLKLRFNQTHSSPAGNAGGEALWRWENCPSGPWVSAADLEALRRAAASAAAVESASVIVAAAPGDQSQVSAKQLAAHAGCSDRQIREVLQDCPAEIDSTGRRLWRYADAVKVLRCWAESHRQVRLRVVWPDLAKNLKNKAAGTKKK